MPIPWNRVDVRLNARGRVRCEPGWRLAPEWSDRLGDFDLWFVWAGRGAMALRGRSVELRPGVCLWMRPGGRYVAEQDPDDRLGVTFLHFDIIGRGGERVGAEALPAEAHDVVDIAYVDAVLARVAGRVTVSEGLVRVFTGVLMELDAGSLSARAVDAGAAGRHREVALKAAARLREDPAGAPTVAELADAAGYTADHFTRVFRDVVGRGPQEYLVGLRIDRARQMLVESSLTVSQIAEVLGYRDVYFFSRQFKLRTGRSPSEFRRGLSGGGGGGGR